MTWSNIKVALVIPLYLILLTVVYIYFIILAILLIPFAIYRLIVAKIAPHIRPKLGRILSLADVAHTSRRNQNSPLATYIFSELQISGQVNLDQFKSEFDAKILNLKSSDGQLIYPELRQKIVSFLSHLFWTNCQDFKIEDHFGYYQSPNVRLEITDDTITIRHKLNIIFKEIMSTEFPPGRPMWNIYFIKNEKENKTVLILKIHHAICDCFSILKIISQIFSPGQVLQKTEQIEPFQKPLKNKNYCDKILKFSRTFWAMTNLFLTGLQNKTVWQKNPQNSDYEVKATELPLGHSNLVPFYKLRKIAQNQNVKVSSVILAGICGGLRNYLLKNKYEITSNPIMGVAIRRPNHPDQKFSNHVYGWGFALPIGTEDGFSRLKLVYSRYEKHRENYFMQLYTYYSLYFNNLPHKLLTHASIFQKKYRPADIAFGYSGVPGPKTSLMWRGLDVQLIGFIVPEYLWGLGLTINSLSNNEGVRFIATGLKSIWPNDKAILELFKFIEQEFDILEKIQNNDTKSSTRVVV